MNPIDLKLNNKYIKALESPIRPGALGKKPFWHDKLKNS